MGKKVKRLVIAYTFLFVIMFIMIKVSCVLLKVEHNNTLVIIGTLFSVLMVDIVGNLLFNDSLTK